MHSYALHTPEQISATLAERLKQLRLARGWRRVTLADRSGVSLGSLRRFEESGKVSLQNLLKLAFALGQLDDFDRLFEPPPASSIAELEAREERPKRQRGRI